MKTTFKVGDRFQRFVVQTFTGIVTITKILPSGRYRLSDGGIARDFGGCLHACTSQYHNPVRYTAVQEPK